LTSRSLGDALTTYSSELSPKTFSVLALGLHLHSLHPLATPMSIMVSVGLSKSGRMDLIFVDSRVKNWTSEGGWKCENEKNKMAC